MHGLMQDYELTLDRFAAHAQRWHSTREVVTRTVEGPIARSTYGEVFERARRLSNALLRLGISSGDRVATMGWNTARHFEAWYGIMGVGAIYHTINPRLFAEQIVWIANHAEDRILMVDIGFAPIIEQLHARLPKLEHLVYLTDRANMPASTFASTLCYEELIEGESSTVAWGGYSEKTASGLCYTSGTTGDPKGVLYSHRSSYLHTLSVLSAEVFALREADAILPVVPMYHVNAWAIPFAAPAAGAKLVMPGAKLDGQSIYELMESEGVTISAGVPTIWQALLNHVRDIKGKFTTLDRVLVGGAACPDAIIRGFEDLGVQVCHAWGMTETSSAATTASLTHEAANLGKEETIRLKLKQGRPFVGVDLKIDDDEGNELARDGVKFGNLKIKAPFVTKAYYRAEKDAVDADGWFNTDDVATIDPAGYMQITDRAKDVIKSGGEWISSIEIENLALGHPKAAHAAVIGVPHPKWDERPLLLVKLKEGQTATRDEFLTFLDGKIAKWCIPDDVVFVDEIPLGPTGKIDKRTLRTRIKDLTA